MTKKEYEKKIDELQAQIDELKNTQIDELKNTQIDELKNTQIDELKNTQIEETKSVLPTPPHPRWKPEQGYYYYCVEANLVSAISFYYNGEARDALLENEFDIGNVFRTKSEAEFAVERLKVLAEMREWAGNWRNVYTLAWDDADGKITTDVSLVYHGEMCFATKEDAEGCIKAVGEDRIKKYYFMVSEV